MAMIGISKELPRNSAGFEIGKQIARSGGSPYANYAEAKYAVSRADFRHRMRICRKELNESFAWMKVITKSGLLSWERIKPHYEECNELIAMFTSIIKKLEDNS